MTDIFPIVQLAQLADGAWWLQQQQGLLALHAQAPWIFCAGFFALFVVLAALAVPGCSVLALTAGLCFGFVGGTALVVLASTIGASLAFLAARHGLRERVMRRYGERLLPLERAIARDGALYVFTLRVAPVIPYPLLNPLMGVSSISLRRFFVASALGMTAGSATYVYAGLQLQGSLVSGQWLKPGLCAALAALALLPWLGRLWWRRQGGSAR
jgi:uncharacterized membrane protein YdjX (TVP38/TMEM64 family)